MYGIHINGLKELPLSAVSDFDLIEDHLRVEADQRDKRRLRERLTRRLMRGRSDVAMERGRALRETAKLRVQERRFARRRARRLKAAA